MEVNTTTMSLIITVHTMGFVDKRQIQEHHKKMVCQKECTGQLWSVQGV